MVCHNVEPDVIAAALGGWSAHPQVRLLHVSDGIPSPAGPINAGLDAATGEFTALLGSDDEYEPGAIDAWVAVSRRDGADLVIPPLRTSPGAATRTPDPAVPHPEAGRSARSPGVPHGAARAGVTSPVRRGTDDDRLRSGEDIIQVQACGTRMPGSAGWAADPATSSIRTTPPTGPPAARSPPLSRCSSSTPCWPRASVSRPHAGAAGVVRGKAPADDTSREHPRSQPADRCSRSRPRSTAPRRGAHPRRGAVRRPDPESPRGGDPR